MRPPSRPAPLHCCRGHSFLSLNQGLLDRYAECATAAEVIAAQQAHLESMQAGAGAHRRLPAGMRGGSEGEEEEEPPAGSEGLPALASDASSGSESDGGEPQGPAAARGPAQAQQQQQASQEDGPPGLADSDGGSSWEGSDAGGDQPAEHGAP